MKKLLRIIFLCSLATTQLFCANAGSDPYDTQQTLLEFANKHTPPLFQGVAQLAENLHPNRPQDQINFIKARFLAIEPGQNPLIVFLKKKHNIKT